jgi:Bacterial PH domain
MRMLAEFEGRFSYREAAHLVADRITPDEELRAVVEASHGSPRLGLLALTTKRLLYVRSRIVRRPLVISVPFGTITGWRYAERPVSGQLDLELADGSRMQFRSLVPKDRAGIFAEPQLDI